MVIPGVVIIAVFQDVLLTIGVMKRSAPVLRAWKYIGIVLIVLSLISCLRSLEVAWFGFPRIVIRLAMTRHDFHSERTGRALGAFSLQKVKSKF